MVSTKENTRWLACLINDQVYPAEANAVI
jgi:hypothetical protein